MDKKHYFWQPATCRERRFIIMILLLYHLLLSLTTTSTNFRQSILLCPIKISVNSATVEEIQAIPEVGYLRALAIYRYRRLYGPVKQQGELQYINGIGTRLQQTIKKYIEIK